jgi:hypothetical protein
MQDVRIARWCVRRQLYFSVKWLRIVLSVGNIFRMNALPPHSRSMRGKCHSFTFSAHCSNWPVQRFGYFHFVSIFLAVWQSHVFTLRTFILQMRARILSELLFPVALKWATLKLVVLTCCWLKWHRTGIHTMECIAAWSGVHPHFSINLVISSKGSF